MTTHAIVRAAPGADLSIQETMQIAEHFARSGYFKDAADVSKAIVRIMAGRELGIGPMTAMTGIHIVQGKPALSAGLVAALVLRSGRYHYEVLLSTDEECRLEWHRDGRRVGESSFTIAEAKRAGLSGKETWKNYPSDLCFARALTRGARRFCADVFLGAVYVPEELGGDVDPDTGEVIEVQVQRPTNGHASPPAPDAPTAFEPASDPEPDWHATPLIDALDSTEAGLPVLRLIVANVPTGHHRAGAITKALCRMADLAEHYEDLAIVADAYGKAKHALKADQRSSVEFAMDAAKIVIDEALAEVEEPVTAGAEAVPA